MITSFEGKYSFLSNFYACQTEYHNVKYPTSEHAYQAAKQVTQYRGKQLKMQTLQMTQNEWEEE